MKERGARALPESLQSLIAARLDGLPPERKALVGDAAVVGEVFWTGAVAALDHGDRTAAEEGLRDLAQRDLLRHNRDSSLAGENEFAFRHALIRDVAYEQLTRADRAAKHAAVARWLEATAGERMKRSPRSSRTTTRGHSSSLRRPATTPWQRNSTVRPREPSSWRGGSPWAST